MMGSSQTPMIEGAVAEFAKANNIALSSSRGEHFDVSAKFGLAAAVSLLSRLLALPLGEHGEGVRVDLRIIGFRRAKSETIPLVRGLRHYLTQFAGDFGLRPRDLSNGSDRFRVEMTLTQEQFLGMAEAVRGAEGPMWFTVTALQPEPAEARASEAGQPAERRRWPDA